MVVACDLSNYSGNMLIQTKMIALYKKPSNTSKIETIEEIFQIYI